MRYAFFYIYLIAIILGFFICIYKRPIGLSHLIIGITSAAYSVSFDIIFGDWLGLYYYLDLRNSTLYIVLSGLFLYPLLNIIYIRFLPENARKLLPYTGVWIVGLIVFEYITVKQKIIVFTGWKPIPWSFTLYVFTYLWMNILYKYIVKKYDLAERLT